METTRHQLDAPCSHPLELTLHKASNDVKGVVQINPATGVTERMYLPFAQYLATQGFAVVTFNYRGVGLQSMEARSVDAGFTDWADHDIERITSWVSEHFGSLPHFAIGHSFGGHAIGLCESSQRLKAAVTICSHAGCLRFIHPLRERWKVAFLLKVLGPVTAKLFGYFPGKRLGVSENVPAKIMRQWSRWTSMPNYFFDDLEVDAARRFARPTMPLLAIGIDDDQWAPPEAIDLMTSHFTGCAVTRIQLGSNESQGTPVGHMGYFRSRHADTLWPVIGQWLHRQL